MKKRSLYGFVLSILCITGGWHTAHAESQRDFLMAGIRPLGMGNAFIATEGTDSNALYYNPASINDYEKKLRYNFLSPTVDFGNGSLQFISDLQGLADDINDAQTDSAKNTIFGNFTKANFGRIENYRASIPIAQVMHRYFSVGLIADSTTRVALQDPSFQSFTLRSRTDGGVAMGTGWGWFGGRLQTGIALKALYRVYNNDTITQRDVVVSGNLGDAIKFNKGFGVGVDIGLKYRVPELIAAFGVLKPVLGFTWQDIGNTRFTGTNVDNKAQSVSVGFALNPKIGPLETTFAFDVRDLNHRADFITLMHLGYEVRFPEFFKTKASVRIGANQGYVGGGFTLDWRFVKLSGVTYGEEAGDVSRVKQLRRWGAELAFGF